MIKCLEPGCSQFISDPCGTVGLLFNFRYFLEDLKTNLEIGTQLHNATEIQLEDVKDRIKSFGIINQEDHYEIFRQAKVNDDTELKIGTQRELYLECNKGHRNIYRVDCTS